MERESNVTAARVVDLDNSAGRSMCKLFSRYFEESVELFTFLVSLASASC